VYYKTLANHKRNYKNYNIWLSVLKRSNDIVESEQRDQQPEPCPLINRINNCTVSLDSQATEEIYRSFAITWKGP